MIDQLLDIQYKMIMILMMILKTKLFIKKRRMTYQLMLKSSVHQVNLNLISFLYMVEITPKGSEKLSSREVIGSNIMMRGSALRSVTLFGGQ